MAKKKAESKEKEENNNLSSLPGELKRKKVKKLIEVVLVLLLMLLITGSSTKAYTDYFACFDADYTYCRIEGATITTQVAGIAIDGQNIYILNSSESKVIKLDSNCNIIEKINISFLTNAAVGLTGIDVYNDFLYIGDTGGDKLVKVNKSDNTSYTVYNIGTYTGDLTDIGDVSINGSHIYITNYHNNKTYEMDQSLNVIRTWDFTNICTRASCLIGLAVNDSDILIRDTYTNGTLFIDDSGQVHHFLNFSELNIKSPLYGLDTNGTDIFAINATGTIFRFKNLRSPSIIKAYSGHLNKSTVTNNKTRNLTIRPNQTGAFNITLCLPRLNESKINFSCNYKCSNCDHIINQNLSTGPPNNLDYCNVSVFSNADLTIDDVVRIEEDKSTELKGLSGLPKGIAGTLLLLIVIYTISRTRKSESW